MSNLGKLAILLPPRLSVSLTTFSDFHRLSFTGPTEIVKSITLPLDCQISLTPSTLSVRYPSSGKMWGTVSQTIRQIIRGVTTGFTKTLSISGIGYKASCSGDGSASYLNLSLGFSHERNVNIPDDVQVSCPNPTTIALKSNSYLKLTAFAHHVAAFRPAAKDRYKKKGVEVATRG